MTQRGPRSIHSRTLLVAVLAIAIIVAGCTFGPPSSEPTTSDGDPLQLPVSYSSDTGAIRGIVTDESLLPVAGAHVALDAGDLTQTRHDGMFSFSDVAPGSYSLQASADGFSNASKAITVIAGEVSDVRLAIQALGGQDAYHETLIQDARMTCAVNYQGPGPPPFNSANLGCNWVTLVAGPNPLDQDLTTFAVTPYDGVAGLWMETVWQPSQVFAQEAQVLWMIKENSDDATVTGDPILYTQGTSPAVGNVTRAALDNVTAEETDLECVPEECTVLAFHSAYRTSTGVSLLLDQRFSDHLTVFYGGEMPQRFTALPDA